MNCAEFLGNADAKARLASYADSGRFPHALLIEGPAGSGRRTLARLFARAAVCTGAGEKPCGVCPACRKALDGAHPDIEEWGGDTRSFKVDAVRELREGAYVLPNEAPRRVMILAGADSMTVQAQNAILKILEEPPESLLFVLTCENRALLLPTVRSRTLCITLHGVEAAEALPLMKRRMPEVPQEQLVEALKLYDGCIGRALDAVAGDGLTRVRALSEQIAAAVTAPAEWTLTAALAPLDQKDKTLTDDVLAALVLLFCDALAVSQGAARAVSPTAGKLASQLTSPHLAALTDATRALQQMRRRNVNQTLFLNLMSARLRTAAGRD